MKRKIIIYYLLVATAVGGILLFIKNQAKAKKNLLNAFSYSTNDSYVITTPFINTESSEEYPDSYDVILVFGGTDYATPSWMQKQVPFEIASKNLMYFFPYTIKFEDAIKFLDERKNFDGFSVHSLSVIGFSAGGIKALSGYSKSLKFFGLIDPSTSNSYTSLVFGTNAHMVFNNKNWGAYPTTKSTQYKIAENIRKGGGTTEEVTSSHINIPKYFFEKFSGILSN